MNEKAMSDRPRVAYFCMEFALHKDLPIYAGGLGVLAGDYLKSAHDLGLPVVGVGILWQKGYTRQLIDGDGRPYDSYPALETDCVRDTGVRVTVTIKGRQVVCRVSVVDCYGNAPLFLLDVNLPENEERWLTDRLYGGSGDDRIAQEIILGVGGLRALRALGIQADVFHFNEGHAVLAGIELIREKMARGRSFAQAWHATREEVVFTTHTPVPAGNEVHHLGALRYVGAFNGLSHEEMAAIGGDPFNMTVAGLRLSRIANAVSQLHAETARTMWAGVENGARIIAVTNGVHAGTWQDPALAEAFAGGGDLLGPHQAAKEALLSLVEQRTGQSLRGGLLIGFARRAAPYKRGDLLFTRPEIIEPMLAAGRVKLIYAGKAHPDDGHGREMVARMVRIARQYANAVAFLEDYDLTLGQALTRGCDLWLNNPRRPMEASGTSGMKAALNGVLNLSVLDGWWPEGCRHGVCGWQFGDAAPHDDAEDAAKLYAVLREEVLPVFEGDRAGWLRMMRESIKMAGSFTAERMVKEYYEKLYRREHAAQASA